MPEAPAPDPVKLTDTEIERRKKFVGLGSDDVARVVKLGELVARNADKYAESFLDHLRELPEAAPLFKRPAILEQIKQLKQQHLLAMVEGDYGRSYVEQRVRLGLLYSAAELDARVFLGAFHHLVTTIGMDVMKHFERDPREAFERFASLRKVSFLDIGIIVDVLIAGRERTILLQQEAIRELSTPVLQIRDRLLILPIIGVIDTKRAKQLTDDLLRAIRANRAKVVVMDITGVAAVDSKVANHLIQTVAAARLMGATVVVTGLTAEVAQALVALGVNLGMLNTVGDLQGGLEEAERMLGYRLVTNGPTSPAPLQ